ncbi:MAG: hypothetical protein L0H53_00795 [Candidatus Nitrosocosmicus sp.]|nr:hypothetical protein [Candidatus Nitrosocosmicus sp.]MDN5865955.1 hypothetical protein [Candidatus Nitrosocosmicus sp.]
MNYKFKSARTMFLVVALFSIGLISTTSLLQSDVSATISSEIPELGCIIGCFEGQGEQGPPGPQGPEGPQGPPGETCAHTSRLPTPTHLPNGASEVCTTEPPPSPSIVDGNQVYAPGYFD